MRFQFKYYLSFIAFVLAALLLSGCSYQSTNENINYSDIVKAYSESSDYEIKDETNINDEYYVNLNKDDEQIELKISSANYFELNYSYNGTDNIDFESVLELVNNISKKEYEYEFADAVINNTDPYYNCEEYYESDSYKDYQQCKIDYLDDVMRDYCLQYIKYDDTDQTIYFSGFTE